MDSRYVAREKLSYTYDDALMDLGGSKPDAAELQRLVEYYPTYEWEHRMKLLHGVFENKSIEQLLADKLAAKGIAGPLTKRSKGGHVRWIITKFRKTVLRLIYLRLRLDQGRTQRSANQILLQKHWSTYARGLGQAHLRKMTHSPGLDA